MLSLHRVLRLYRTGFPGVVYCEWSGLVTSLACQQAKCAVQSPARRLSRSGRPAAAPPAMHISYAQQDTCSSTCTLLALSCALRARLADGRKEWGVTGEKSDGGGACTRASGHVWGAPVTQGACLPQRAAPVTPRAHHVLARRTSLLWSWQG